MSAANTLERRSESNKQVAEWLRNAVDAKIAEWAAIKKIEDLLEQDITFADDLVEQLAVAVDSASELSMETIIKELGKLL